MKKLLIATAALAMVAGTAQAQSSVTIYGNADVNINSTKTAGATGTNTAMGESALVTSRLGFRGTEDLGGGLKAEFQLESRLNPTNGQLGAASTTTGTNSSANQTVPAATIFSREAWVGLSGKFGAVRFGRTDLTSAQGFDSTVGQVGDLSNTRSGDLGQDVDKVIRYTTPKFNGLTAEVGYSNASATSTAAAASATANVTNGETTLGKLTSATIKYEAGKLGLYAGQTTNKLAAGDQDDTFLGATYDFGVAKVGVALRERDGVTTGALDAAKDLKQTIYSVSAPVSALGAGVKVHAAYHVSESTTKVATDSKKTTLALTKALSKRTTGYVAYIDDDLQLTGNDTKATVVGINHAF